MEKPNPGLYFVATSGNLASVAYASVEIGIAFYLEWRDPKTPEDTKEFEVFSYGLMSEIAAGLLAQMSNGLKKGETLGTGSIGTGIKGVC